MLVSKKLEINAGDPAVELLEGEQTEQSYVLHLDVVQSIPIWIGGEDVNSTDSAPLQANLYRVRGESLWVIGPPTGTGSVTLRILAYSTD